MAHEVSRCSSAFLFELLPPVVVIYQSTVGITGAWQDLCQDSVIEYPMELSQLLACVLINVCLDYIST